MEVQFPPVTLTIPPLPRQAADPSDAGVRGLSGRQDGREVLAGSDQEIAQAFRDEQLAVGDIAVSYGAKPYDRVKRAIDIGVAAVGLVLALPVIVLAAVLLRCESSGSPFFGHVRIGRGGRRFRCWKLRTMYRDAEERLERDPALRDAYRRNDFKLPEDQDPRVTRLGAVLRKTSLDELPQLVNVLRGEMSLVGPRPIVAEELAHYQGQVATLLSVRPGITGAWAVSGRHHLAYPARALVELDYVRLRSLRVDASILVRTIAAVFNPGFDRVTAVERAPSASSTSPSLRLDSVE